MIVMEMLYLLAVFSHFTALFSAFLSVYKYSDLFKNVPWDDVNLDYIFLVFSIIHSSFSLFLLVNLMIDNNDNLILVLNYVLTGLIMAYWHSSIRKKYKDRLP